MTADEKIAACRRALTDAVLIDLRADGCLRESNDAINAASHQLVEAMCGAHPEAVLICVNPGRGQPVARPAGTGARDSWADYILPRPDAEVERLCRERLEATYTGTREDAVRLYAIEQAVRAAGGETLLWT